MGVVDGNGWGNIRTNGYTDGVGFRTRSTTSDIQSFEIWLPVDGDKKINYLSAGGTAKVSIWIKGYRWTR